MPNAEPRPIPLDAFVHESRGQADAHRPGLSAGAHALQGGFSAVRSLLTWCLDYSRDETRDGVSFPRRPLKSRSARSNLIAGAIKPIRHYPPTRLVAGSLSIGHRAPSGFDCFASSPKVRSQPSFCQFPFGSLSSCQICRYSPEKRPVDMISSLRLRIPHPCTINRWVGIGPQR